VPADGSPIGIDDNPIPVHFDFPAIHRCDYLADPHDHVITGGLLLHVRHSEAQKVDLTKYFTQFGRTQEGIAQFLQRNDTHLSAVLYRQVDYGEPYNPADEDVAPAPQVAPPSPCAVARAGAGAGSPLSPLAWSSKPAAEGR
jgi:hypothetical protein